MGSATTSAESYTAVPMAGLVRGTVVPFPLYLRTGDDNFVLYRAGGSELDDGHLGRLHAEGVAYLMIRDQDRRAYFERVEADIGDVLLDRSVPLADRADLLQGIALVVVDELMAAEPRQPELARAKRVMMAMSNLVLRESQGFQAVRKVLGGGDGLARHSLTVAALSMGLARVVMGGDAASMALVGLAGLLHDVGHIGHEELEHDPEHTTRGAQMLRRLGLPAPVVATAQMHHECCDGSGFPDGLVAAEIPDLPRLVGLVTLFDKVYTGQEPRVGVFDALRILAQAYRGCFDERMAQGLVKLFR